MAQVTSSVMLRNRLKMRQLSLLAALGESPSLHKAAERLGMSQPAATRLLHELEEMLCCPLFERTNRGLVATDTGRLLVRHATAFVAGIDKVYEDACLLRAGNTGSLRIGVSTAARPDLVPQSVLALKQSTPQIFVQIQDGGHADLLSSLMRGALDLVVGRAPALDRESQIHFEPLYGEAFVVVAGISTRSTPQATRDCSLVELVDRPWILPPSETALRKTIENQFVGLCGRLPTDVIDSVSVSTNLALLAQSRYVALMPKGIADYHAKRSQLRLLTSAVPNLSGTVGMMWMHGSQGQPQMVRLIKTLQDTCKDS